MESRVTNRIEHARPLGELLGELRDETTLLIRDEIALAKTEMTENVARASRSGILMAAGGLIGYAGLLFILAAMTGLITLGLEAAGLSPANAGWLSALITGIITAGIGAAVLFKGKRSLGSLVPRKTIDTLEEDKAWIHQHINEI